MRLWLTLIFCVAVAGCVTTRFTLIDPSLEPYPPVTPETVRIMTSEAELDTLEYVRIAIIEATGSGEYTDQTAMIAAMRKRAGELGANAILLPEIEEPGAGARVAAAVFGTGTQRRGSVIAIRILRPRGGTIERATNSRPVPRVLLELDS